MRALRRHLLDEPIPGGTGWWFTTGSVVLFLLGVQLASGVLLTFYYVPSPASAYDFESKLSAVKNSLASNWKSITPVPWGLKEY